MKVGRIIGKGDTRVELEKIRGGASRLNYAVKAIMIKQEYA